jgi:signal transduction histidine kinase
MTPTVTRTVGVRGAGVFVDRLEARDLLRSAGARFRALPGMQATVIVSAIVLVAVTATLALAPQLHLGYPRETADLALDTAASVIGLLAYFLVFGRLCRRARLNENLLACGLAVLAVSSLFLCTVPAVAGWAPDDLTAWVAPAANSFGALLFVLAAFLPDRQLRLPGPALATSLLVAMVLVPAFARPLPPQVVASLAPGSAGHPNLHVAQFSPQLAGTVLYGAAAAGFLRRSRRSRDEFFWWLALAAMLAAASQVNYLLSAMNPQSLYGGDAFRCFFYAVLFLGSMREIWSYWHALSKAAVLEERERIACELHDGVAQELAYLARNLESLDAGADEDGLDRLRRAVERARLESRRVIGAGAAPSSRAFEVVLAEAVTEVADRYHVELGLDLTSDIRLPAPRRETFVRIACEAVANAARHSGADRVDLRLERDGSGVRLRVSDEGNGFDTADPGGGFGLTSMRKRAHSIGAELVVSSVPGHGSRVEVTL